MDNLPGFNLAHILVVETRPKMADYIVAVLRSGGYLVQSATHVGEALTIDHSRFNLAVVNGTLRDSQGVDIRQRIGQVASFAALPVLFIDVNAAPFDESQLLNKVQTMLERGTSGDYEAENWQQVLEAPVKNANVAQSGQAKQ